MLTLHHMTIHHMCGLRHACIYFPTWCLAASAFYCMIPQFIFSPSLSGTFDPSACIYTV